MECNNEKQDWHEDFLILQFIIGSLKYKNGSKSRYRGGF